MVFKRDTSRRVPAAVATLVLALVAGLAFTGSSSAERPDDRPEGQASRRSAPVPAPRQPAPLPEERTTRASRELAPMLRGFDPLQHERVDSLVVSPLRGGRRAVLTLDAELQGHLEDELERYEVPFGAVVAMRPDTGRVLAYVSHSSENPAAGDLVLDPTPPTASVFKVITGAALVDAGVGPRRSVCYRGGSRRLVASHLEEPPSGAPCATLGEAMGRSINVIFARMADRYLDEPTLERYASAFGFGHSLPFDVPTRPSPGEVPSERLERARTAAGFWHMHMSPLHGALIAATIANDGMMPRAAMVERVEDAGGDTLYELEPEDFRQVIPRATARTVGRMMRRTTQRRGTGYRSFHDPQGRPFLPGVEVAGKTGSLTADHPHRAYSWFVGYAPADDPQIAVAALVVNGPRWRIKAAYMAREAMRIGLRELAREAEAEAEAASAAAAPTSTE